MAGLTDEVLVAVQSRPTRDHPPEISQPPTAVFRFDPGIFEVGLSSVEAKNVWWKKGRSLADGEDVFGGRHLDLLRWQRSSMPASESAARDPELVRQLRHDVRSRV